MLVEGYQKIANSILKMQIPLEQELTKYNLWTKSRTAFSYDLSFFLIVGKSQRKNNIS